MQSNLVEHGTAYQMLIDGTVQAAGTHVPSLYLHKSLSECLSFIEENRRQNELKICLDNINPRGSLTEILKTNQEAENVIAAIGSERGWTENERKLLESKGFIRAGMGSRVMRTETAATVSAGVISALMGWMEK